MFSSIIALFANLFGIVLRVQTDKNSLEMKSAKEAQKQVDIQNEAELAIKEKNDKKISELLS